MTSEKHCRLDEAKAHYYALKFVDAYHLFRRFFGRIPFSFETEHAEYIGMFVRTLSELGKNQELHFYVTELERRYEKTKDPMVAYPLAVVYRNLPDPKHEKAKIIFEEIIRDSSAGIYRVKAKMMLAHYYDWKNNNTSACRELIFSIERPEDPSLRALWEIWKAKILRDEGKFDEAQKTLHRVLEAVTLQSDWYAYFSAKVVLAIVLLKKGEVDKASAQVAEVRYLFEGRNFRSLRIQIEELERQITERSPPGKVRYVEKKGGAEFFYENRILRLRKSSPAEKLLRHFVKKGYLDKPGIVKLLYERQYDGASDDRLIYYHIHALRKRFQGMGLAESFIVNEREGYRLAFKVEMIREVL